MADINLTTAQAALMVSCIVGLFAIYGAVNARRALDWQKQRDIERRQTRVRIHIEQWSSFGRDDGRPTAGMSPEEVGSLCRVWITVSVINDSEATTVYVRDIDVLGQRSYEGQPVMSAEPDERLEPRQRLVRHVSIDEQDIEEFSKDGFVVRARLSTGEMIEQRDRLLADLVQMPGLMMAAHQRRARRDFPRAS